MVVAAHYFLGLRRSQAARDAAEYSEAQNAVKERAVAEAQAWT